MLPSSIRSLEPDVLSVHCRFGSYAVTSSVPLPALPATAPDLGAPVIHVDWIDHPCPDEARLLHDWLEGEEAVLTLTEADGDLWLKAPGTAHFRLRTAPHGIGVHVTGDNVDEATLEHQLVDQILPRLLNHIGELVVHASALGINGRHALFLGASGMGKSTLAGLLRIRGHLVLSDDCVQVMAKDSECIALPTYPSLRLLKDSMEMLYPRDSDSFPVAGWSEKRRVPVDPVVRDGESTSIDAIYLLGDPTKSGDTIQITPIAPAEACLTLITHSFRMDLGNHAATARHLAHCSAIARMVPAFRLNFPRSFDRHDDIAAAIVGHLDGLETIRTA